MEITICGVKKDVQTYYNSLRLKFGSNVSWEKCSSIDSMFGEVVIILQCDNFSESVLHLYGYEKVSIKYVTLLDPYRVTYFKKVGESHFHAKQEELIKFPDEHLRDFEELETYEERLLQISKEAM